MGIPSGLTKVEKDLINNLGFLKQNHFEREKMKKIAS